VNTIKRIESVLHLMPALMHVELFLKEIIRNGEKVRRSIELKV
jgi:hypothetical protein